MLKDAIHEYYVFWDAEVLFIIAWSDTFEFFPNISKCDIIVHGSIAAFTCHSSNLRLIFLKSL